MSWSPIPSHEEIDNRPVKCMVCGKENTFAESMPAEMVRDSLVRLRADHDYRVNRSLHEKIDPTNGSGSWRSSRGRPIFCRNCAHQKAGREGGKIPFFPCEVYNSSIG